MGWRRRVSFALVAMAGWAAMAVSAAGFWAARGAAAKIRDKAAEGWESGTAEVTAGLPARAMAPEAELQEAARLAEVVLERAPQSESSE